MYLEQHLLSLYRKAFEQQITHLSPSAGNGIEIDSKKQMSSPSEALPKAAPTLDSSPRKQNPSTNVQSGQIVLPRDAWSPGFRKEATLEAWLDNPFRVDGLKDFSGPYNAMVEVSSICRETQRFSDAEVMLHNYNSLVHRLETVDPSGMKSEEKFAFWINVHNAMTMHAHLEHGVPQSSMKRASLLTKTTYIINGASINAEIIQDILGCRINPPGQWLRILLYPKSHPKDGDEWQAYSVKHPEPLLHFALCSGTRSDPAVRIYSPKRLFQQLEAAKEEYIRATISIQKEQKILLPKNIETYAKAADLTADDLLNMIRSSLPESLRMIMERCRQGRSRKLIQWVPHNYSFRYLIPRELAQFSHNTSM
ncbi:hypothetical protein ACMD2_09645 [Ananas comosus]|uniref:DUF547 domain-containing protein n=1 Tax=Ananas comosus TaxID=4615 RepID=A0A199VUX3_ANACO|nr:hypothetical protein ACMD2_09645 [Ananas comosus]